MNRFIALLPLLFAIAQAGYMTEALYGKSESPAQATHSVFNDASSDLGASGLLTSADASGYEAADADYEAEALTAGQHSFGASDFDRSGGHAFGSDVHSAEKTYTDGADYSSGGHEIAPYSEALSAAGSYENGGHAEYTIPANHAGSSYEESAHVSDIGGDAGHDGGFDLSAFGVHDHKGGHGGGHGGDHGGHGGGHGGHEKHILSEIHHHHKTHAKVSYKDTPITSYKAYIKTVDKPYAIHVPVSKPVTVEVVKELKIPVEKHIPYKVEKKIPFKVEKHVPYKVIKHIPVYVPKPYAVKVPIYKTIVHKLKSDKH